MINSFDRDTRKLTRIERINSRYDRLWTRIVNGDTDRRRLKRAIRLDAKAKRLFEIRKARFAANGFRSPRP